MSKKIFRFLRGELNGFYIGNIGNLMNVVSNNIHKFIANFAAMPFGLDENLLVSGVFNPFDIVKGIGLTAGIFVPYVSQDSNIASIKFSRSHRTATGEEISERGLFSRLNEGFFYQENIPEGTDINTLATSNLRSSMVESGAVPIGYIEEGQSVIDEDGNLDRSKIHLFVDPDNYEAELPTDKAYVLYYGDKYMYLEESTPIIAKIPNTVYVELVKLVQWVRYNGTSVESICKFVNLICPNYLFLFPSFDWSSIYGRAIIKYGVDENYEVDDKLMYVNIFKLIVSIKFPQLVFEEVAVRVTRDDEGNVISVEEIEAA